VTRLLKGLADALERFVVSLRRDATRRTLLVAPGQDDRYARSLARELATARERGE
jgi:hypothetical protein